MPSKKPTKKKPKKTRAPSNRNGRLQLTRFHGAEDDSVLPLYMIEINHPYPVYLNPESEEDRKKRLAARKARTLRIFQTAYENHHRRKAS